MISIRRRITGLAIAVMSISLVVVCGAVIVALWGYAMRFKANMPPAVRAEFARLEAIGQDESARGIEIYVRYRPRVGELALMIGALTVGVLIAVMLVVPVIRSAQRHLGNPLDDVAAAARRVANGDFSIPFEANAFEANVEHDSLSRLRNDFASMIGSLAAMQAEQRRDAANIAHELRTPVSAIHLLIEGAIDRVLEPDRTWLGNLREQTQTLNRLVEDLRTMTLARVGQLQLQCREEAVEALVSRLVDDWSQAMRQSIDFRCNISADALVWVDSVRLRQILANLLNNAFRHGSPPVAVQLSQVGSKVCISVLDAGAKHPTAPGGDRLGLSVVRQLSALMNAAFELQCGQRGSVASLRLPARER